MNKMKINTKSMKRTFCDDKEKTPEKSLSSSLHLKLKYSL